MKENIWQPPLASASPLWL